MLSNLWILFLSQAMCRRRRLCWCPSLRDHPAAPQDWSTWPRWVRSYQACMSHGFEPLRLEWKIKPRDINQWWLSECQHLRYGWTEPYAHITQDCGAYRKCVNVNVMSSDSCKQCDYVSVLLSCSIPDLSLSFSRPDRPAPRPPESRADWGLVFVDIISRV